MTGMDAVTQVPAPANEPVLAYGPGSAERGDIEHALVDLAGGGIELTATIGGRQRMPSGAAFAVRQPHAHAEVLGISAHSTEADTRDAIDAALAAAPAWRDLPFDERAAVFLRAADLLAGPWRARINAATMLGQSKTVQQAEIDAACELIDFWRFNVAFARDLIAEQPTSSRGVWNRADYRPLEGFVYAITPFNFTAIALNLPTAPALMGNVVLWKPSPTQQLAAHIGMRVLEAAGLPPGVINLLPGNGIDVSEVALASQHLAGIHFTGSTATFQKLWSTVGANITSYRSYPRIVGETGGKDFVLAHPSADPDTTRIALLRGALEYSGQKCSAASRAYVARSVWDRCGDDLIAETDGLAVGDVRDLANFTGAVIDDRAFAKHKGAIDRAHATPTIDVRAGGTYDDSVGWFVRPTILESADLSDEIFSTEYFGPILSVHVYDDADYDTIVTHIDETSRYALTGSILADDRQVLADAAQRLRFAAGNFYYNDKPTGAVVGQQPFGGARASGTNDKAGSIWNLIRWVSPRSIKETFDPPHSYGYPHMAG
jgi:1-pyrroline-5-carboxylate dehydrogenase